MFCNSLQQSLLRKMLHTVLYQMLSPIGYGALFSFPNPSPPVFTTAHSTRLFLFLDPSDYKTKQCLFHSTYFHVYLYSQKIALPSILFWLFCNVLVFWYLLYANCLRINFPMLSTCSVSYCGYGWKEQILGMNEIRDKYKHRGHIDTQAIAAMVISNVVYYFYSQQNNYRVNRRQSFNTIYSRWI